VCVSELYIILSVCVCVVQYIKCVFVCVCVSELYIILSVCVCLCCAVY